MKRRGVFAGLAALFVAPKVVPAASTVDAPRIAAAASAKLAEVRADLAAGEGAVEAEIRALNEAAGQILARLDGRWLRASYEATSSSPRIILPTVPSGSPKIVPAISSAASCISGSGESRNCRAEARAALNAASFASFSRAATIPSSNISRAKVDVASFPASSAVIESSMVGVGVPMVEVGARDRNDSVPLLDSVPDHLGGG